jgi:hypothetical protein
LTVKVEAAEIDRYWLKLREAHECAVGDMQSKDIRNWTDRGLVDVKDSPAGTGSPRLYSLASCLQISALHNFKASGGSLTLAKKIADIAVERLRELVAKETDFSSRFAEARHECFLVYTVRADERVSYLFMTPDEIASVLSETLGLGARLPGLEKRLFKIDELISRQIENYFDLVQHCSKDFGLQDE